MKKQLLYSAVIALMLGMNNSVWAEPGEGETPGKEVSNTPVLNQASKNKEKGLEQIQTDPTNSTGSQSGTSTQEPGQTPPVNSENKQAHLLPTILGGTGILLALISLIYSWRKAGSMILTKKQLEDEIKRLRKSEQNLKEQIAEVFKSFQQHQELNNNIIQSLQDEVKKLTDQLSNQSNEKLGAVNRKFLVDDDLVVGGSGVAEVAPMIEVTDADIINKISLEINGILQTSSYKFKSQDFRAILDGLNKDDLNIHSYRLLQNDLKSESSRDFDAIVIMLSKALSSGTNTLIYLQKNVAQHSAISWVFENARDGMVISEMLEPAQLKQISINELDLKEENIVQKGKVTEG